MTSETVQTTNKVKTEKLPPGTRTLYIRDEKSNPIGFIYATQSKSKSRYGFSILNPKDRFNKKLAWFIAQKRHDLLDHAEDKRDSDKVHYCAVSTVDLTTTGWSTRLCNDILVRFAEHIPARVGRALAAMST